MSAWITGGAMVVGGIMSGIGANKASKAQDKATAANQAAQEEADRVNWAQYLMQRGIMPRGQVTPGVVPTNYTATNTRLPIWATMTRRLPGAPASPATGGASASPAMPAAPVPAGGAPRGAVPRLRRA